MRFDLSPDQEFFRETTAKFLAAHATVDVLRKLRDDAAGFDRGYWAEGAALGWTSLLVSEQHGGGTISGEGVVDATLLAHEFGRAAAPGPFLSSNLVAAALSDAGAHLDVLAGVLDGTLVATYCVGEAPTDAGVDDVRLEIRVDGDSLVLDGVKRPVESAPESDHLLVSGRTADGFTQVLVPRHIAGITVEQLRGVDLTRRFSKVTFDSVRVPATATVGGLGTARDQIDRQLQLGSVLLTAESVGAMQRAFEMTLEWAFDRYSFGRPLASYQEVKHRFADMKSWLEASHAISDAAAAAVQAGSPEAAELVAAAKAYVGQYGVELAHDCVQLHGGIGVTFEHDLHLFLRRIVLNQGLLGAPAAHRQRITEIIEREGRGA